MLDQVNDLLKNGLRVNGHTIYAKSISEGRFREEKDIELFLRGGNEKTYLLYVKLFCGRPPEYQPWVELFDINEHLQLGGHVFDYFDSPFEDSVLRFFADNTAPGSKLFVEYYNDVETQTQLAASIPVVISRLGYKMFKLGFTWFKDWYFPEGYMEGNQKLQGEKPLNAAARERHIKTMSKELASFEQRLAHTDHVQEYTRRAAARRETISALFKDNSPG